jgi:hypothetical protein
LSFVIPSESEQMRGRVEGPWGSALFDFAHFVYWEQS